MTEEYNPPIRERGNDELIIIVHGPQGDWQPSAVKQAIAELEKRGITEAQQKKRIKEIDSEIEQVWKVELENRKIEDFNTVEKIFRVIFWYKDIFNDWYLRKEGYELKAKRRLQLLGAGIFIYLLFFLWAYNSGKEMERKHIEEIHKE